jgi:acetyl esterase
MASTYDVTTEDIEYLRPGGKPLLARLYRPKGPGPFPALIEVHGGAWVMNDRLANAAICTPLAASGAVVMSIDFRMPPEAKYPASIADINFAVRWLKAKARDLGTRPDLVGGLGTSSGAHQLLLNAFKPKDSRYTAHPHPAATDAKLAFAVLCWPIADPLARYRMVQRKGNARLVEAHEQYWAGEVEMTEGNPQLMLERGEPVELPPVIVLQGTADDNVTPDMADKFSAAYRKAGGRVTLEKYDDQPHTFIPKDPTTPASLKAIESIKAFVRSQAS